MKRTPRKLGAAPTYLPEWPKASRYWPHLYMHIRGEKRCCCAPALGWRGRLWLRRC